MKELLDYEQIISKIESSRRFGNEPGAVVTEKIVKRLKENKKLNADIPYIHVAGTNGKGSVCAFLTELLKSSEIKVGTFTSPHLVDFEERIMVDGKKISKADVERIGNYLLEMSCGIGLTMFDYCLALAMLYFEEQGCEAMVIETGLGGRLDSTNAIGTPEVEVITSIGYDHMSILGSDIKSIAAEKAGIIKPQTVVVSQIQEKRAMDVIKAVCRDKKADLISISHDDIEKVKGVRLGLNGDYQRQNAVTAVYAAERFINRTKNRLAKVTFDENIVKDALLHAKWPGRMEILKKDPFFMVDGAHNSNAVKVFAESLSKMYPGEKFNFFIGVMADKDYEEMMQLILPYADRVSTVTPDSERALMADELASYIRKNGVEAHSIDSVEKVLDSLSYEKKNIAFGSLYFIGEIKKIFEKNK